MRTIEKVRRDAGVEPRGARPRPRARRPGADDGRAPRRPPLARRGRAPPRRQGRGVDLRQPDAVRPRRRPRPLPARPRSRQRAPRRRRRRRRCSRPTPARSIRRARRRTSPSRSSSAPLCGAHRPGHFRGVATVVAEALHHRAAARRGLRREGLPAARVHPADGARTSTSTIDVVGAPIVREADGLAMSSRNRLLDEGERARRALRAARARCRGDPRRRRRAGACRDRRRRRRRDHAPSRWRVSSTRSSSIRRRCSRGPS